MDIQILRNYVEIIESGSLTAAAKKLYLAQPALSLQLKSLEKELGATLLIRSAHRLELTEAGKMLYRKAKHIVALENSLKKDVRDCESGVSGILRISAVPSIAFTLCGGYLAQFCRTHLKISVELYEKGVSEALSLLDCGAADIALVRTPCTLTAEMNAIRYARDSMAAIYNSSAIALEGEGNISVTDLSGYTIGVPAQYTRLFNETFSSAAAKSEKKPEKRSIVQPHTGFTSRQLSTLINWAAAGLGIAVVPVSAFIPVYYGDKLTCRIIDEPAFVTERLMVTKKNRVLSPVEKQFCDMLSAEDSGARSKE